MICPVCQRRRATQHDYDTIPEGEGESLCWADMDGDRDQCSTIDPVVAAVLVGEWRAYTTLASIQRTEGRPREERSYQDKASAIRHCIDVLRGAKPPTKVGL